MPMFRPRLFRRDSMMRWSLSFKYPATGVYYPRFLPQIHCKRIILYPFDWQKPRPHICTPALRVLCSIRWKTHEEDFCSLVPLFSASATLPGVRPSQIECLKPMFRNFDPLDVIAARECYGAGGVGLKRGRDARFIAKHSAKRGYPSSGRLDRGMCQQAARTTAADWTEPESFLRQRAFGSDDPVG